VNLEKAIFGFFILLAATLNFGFFVGDIDNPDHHGIYELFAAIVVSLVATVLKLGDRTQIGAVHLSTSLVADLQLIAAALVWGYAAHVSPAGLTPVQRISRPRAARARLLESAGLGGAGGMDRRVCAVTAHRRAAWPVRWRSGSRTGIEWHGGEARRFLLPSPAGTGGVSRDNPVRMMTRLR
jgi:hypothetical protein